MAANDSVLTGSCGSERGAVVPSSLSKAFEWTYTVPDWFSTENVKTRHELTAFRSKLVLVDEGGNETTETVKDSESETVHDVCDGSGTNLVNGNHDNKDQIAAPHCHDGRAAQIAVTELLPSGSEQHAQNTPVASPIKVSAEAFEEVYDAAGSALVVGSNGRLVAAKSSILLCTDSASGLETIDSVVVHLAKEMSANLISIEIADLEDIGSDFLAHEKDLDKLRDISKQKQKQENEEAEKAKADKDKEEIVDNKIENTNVEANGHGDKVDHRQEDSEEEKLDLSQNKTKGRDQAEEPNKEERGEGDDECRREAGAAKCKKHTTKTDTGEGKEDKEGKADKSAMKEKEEKDCKVFDEHYKEREQYDFALPYNFAGFYFGVESRTKATEHATERNKRALAALLDATRVKEGRIVRQEDQSLTDVSADIQQPPIFVHVRDAAEFATRGPLKDWPFEKSAEGSQILSRIREAVQAQRTAARRIVLLFSVVSDIKPYGCDECTHMICATESCGGTLRDDLRVEPGSVIGIRQSGKPASDASAKATRYKHDNIRRLKRSLRAKRLGSIAPGLLAPDTAWTDTKVGRELRILDSSLWSAEDVQHVVARISGRSFRKHHIEVSDIFDILQNIERSKTPDQSAFKARLEDVRKQCNEYEKQFLPNVIDPQRIDSSYDKVILDDDMKATIKQLVSLATLPAEVASHHLIKNLGTNGALFYGPPGTGKTFFAQAIAKDSGATMLAVDGASVTNCWVGETEKRIKATFTLAIKLHPCILFIDEVDSLFYRRGPDDKSWQRAALTQYLQMMDGLVNSKNKPFVVVATNRPSDLDEAFLRRLSHRVHFDLPSQKNRLGILKNFLKDDDIDSSVVLDELATATEGFSGSDLRNLCSEATVAWLVEVGSAFGNKTEPSARPKLLLKADHFAQALGRTQPSVSRRSLALIASFKSRFSKADKGEKEFVEPYSESSHLTRGRPSARTQYEAMIAKPIVPAGTVVPDLDRMRSRV